MVQLYHITSWFFNCQRKIELWTIIVVHKNLKCEISSVAGGRERDVGNIYR